MTPVHKKFDHIYIYIYIYMILTIFKHSPLYILLLQSISLSCATVNHGFCFLFLGRVHVIFRSGYSII